MLPAALTLHRLPVALIDRSLPAPIDDNTYLAFVLYTVIMLGYSFIQENATLCHENNNFNSKAIGHNSALYWPYKLLLSNL